MRVSGRFIATLTFAVLALEGCSSESGGSGPAGGGPNTSGGSVSGSGGTSSGGTSSGGASSGGISTGGTSGGGTSSGGVSTGGSGIGGSFLTGGSPSSTGGSPPSSGGVVSGGSGGNGGSTSGGASGGGGSNTSGGAGTTGSGGGGGRVNTGGAGGSTGGSAGGAGAKGGSAGEAGVGVSPAAALDKFRFECPCKTVTADNNCDVLPETDRQTIMKTMGGDATKIYNVTLRVRGLTEPNTYKSGMLQGERFYVGGSTSTAGYTSYMMTVADPAQHYFFNYNATTGHLHFKLDYQVTVKIRGGSRVTFDVDGDGSVPDGHQVANFDQIVVPDVPPAPAAYNGQFVQLDVVSVEVAP